MKTFLMTFLAILAAAAVIFGCLATKSRLNNWNKAKNACLDEINSMSETIRDISDETKGASLEELTAALRQMTKAQKHINDATQLLLSLLKHKPFGFPLTKDEKELLRVYTTSAEESKQAAVATSVSTDATASPEATTSPTALSSEAAGADNVRSQQPAPEVQAQQAPEIQSPQSEYVTINRDIEVSHSTNKILIPKGSRLPVVSRGSRSVGVRFQNELQIIPKSATSESK